MRQRRLSGVCRLRPGWPVALYLASARELYLNPFEDCVKANQGQALAVMSSYVYVGTTWDGGCSALLNDILRGKWGYKGLVPTDCFGNYGYMDTDKAVRGGSDIMLGTANNDAVLTGQPSVSTYPPALFTGPSFR